VYREGWGFTPLVQPIRGDRKPVKLLIVIINKRDHLRLREALIEEGFRFTEIGSTGGFLREGNVTLLLGVEESQVDHALEIIGTVCRPREQVVQVSAPDTRLYASPVQEAMTVRVGGAQVFVVSVDRAVQI